MLVVFLRSYSAPGQIVQGNPRVDTKVSISQGGKEESYEFDRFYMMMSSYNEQKHVAFGGAVVSQILRRDSESDDNIVCIAFLDNATVETSCFNAASLLLKGRISSETFTKEILAV